ncbi:MAG: GAF domain-containing protein [Bacteroidota bacterium]|nr:GAF domain-containing protein [Bacteroidota bacterium]
MTEEKANKYKLAAEQINAVLDTNISWVGNFANVAAIIQDVFGHWWCGFYLVNNNQLELGPFQGPVACTSIQIGKGVCGTAWAQKRTIIVPDVHQFEGHIACSSASNSEIVVPLFKNEKVIAVLDIDSIHFNQFDEIDKINLETIVQRLSDFYKD